MTRTWRVGDRLHCPGIDPDNVATIDAIDDGVCTISWSTGEVTRMHTDHMGYLTRCPRDDSEVPS